MGTFLLALLVVVLLMAGMSIGVIFGRKPISGTCGGLNAAGVGGPCEICGGDTSKCEEDKARTAGAGNDLPALAYDASKPQSRH